MELNKLGMSIEGDKVAVAGMLDIKGLLALEKKIAGLRALLQTYPDLAAHGRETEH